MLRAGRCRLFIIERVLLRGTEGLRFPWGVTYEPERLNKHDKGPFDTMPVGSLPRGISPLGLTDAAGQVLE